MTEAQGVFAPIFKRRDEIILCPGKRKRKVTLSAGVLKNPKKQRWAPAAGLAFLGVFSLSMYPAVLAAGLNWKSSLPCSIRPKSPVT
jgi:hypothetical protein